MQKLEPWRARGLAYDDLRDVVRVRKVDHVVGNTAVATWNGHWLRSQGLRQPKRVGDAITFLLGQLQAALGLDIKRGPGSMQAVGEALGVTHETCRARVLAYADEQALARSPWARNGARLHLVKQLLVDALGSPPQRQFA